MYKVTFALQPIGDYVDLKKAIKALWDKVKDEIQTGLALQVLETACWIEMPTKTPMYFYDAVDYAHDKGWAVDGEWVEDSLPETLK